jgi:hypothetical protein
MAIQEQIKQEKAAARGVRRMKAFDRLLIRKLKEETPPPDTKGWRLHAPLKRT